MKVSLILICLVSFLNTLYAQDVKLKDKTVSVDGKECLKYDGSDPNNVLFTSLEGKDLFALQFGREFNKLYCRVIFFESRKSLISRSYIFNKKLIIKRLIESKTLVDCQLDPEKVESFILRYDQPRTF